MTVGVIYVMGPSGVGKDSLLNWLRAHVRALPSPPALRFARRTITRAAGISNEDHESLAVDAFLQLEQSGAFALHWQAHGLHYGVRQAEMQGPGWVMVNGSRAYAAQARTRLPGLTVLHVSAPDALVGQRLAARQRETPDQVQARLHRAKAQSVDMEPGDLHIVNAGSLQDTALALCQVLQARTGLHLLEAEASPSVKAGIQVNCFDH